MPWALVVAIDKMVHPITMDLISKILPGISITIPTKDKKKQKLKLLIKEKGAEIPNARVTFKCSEFTRNQHVNNELEFGNLRKVRFPHKK